MESETQNKFREKIVDKYLQDAWECLASYSYWGQKYEAIKKQVTEYEDRIKEFALKIIEIKKLNDAHTKENREKCKAIQKDVDTYNDRIKAVEPMMKKFWDHAVKYQTQGGELLEQAEYLKAFNLKTPKEIAEDKKKPIE